jgi:hypothetical protein
MPASQVVEDEGREFHPHRHRGTGSGLEAVLPSLLSLATADDWQGAVQGSSRRPGSGGRYNIHADGPLRAIRPGTGATPSFPAHDRNFENFIQELIMNVTGMGVAGGGVGAAGGRAGPGGPNLSFHFLPMGGLDPGLQIHGNPGDYAWGRGGLDTIITQLLNQMEGAGPPPMTKENISGIPTVNVTQEVLDKNPNCSVCWEDFKLEEPVMKLECNHCFHKDCIVPWLELHGTCPVCRKVLIPESSRADHSDHGSQEPDPFLDTDPAHPSMASSYHLGDSTSSGTNGQRGDSGHSSGSGGEGASSASSQPAGAGGSLSGFLQSTLGSILGVNLASPTTAGDPGGWSFYQGAHSHPTTSSAASSSNPPPPPSQNSIGTNAGANPPSPQESTGGNSAAARRLPSSPGDTEDTAPPASRRQRLDSDFIDFDLE